MLEQPKKSPTLKNAVLASLPPQDLLAISPFLKPIVLKERVALQEPNKPVEHVYFVESGVVSQRIVAAGSMIETAVVGYRGAVGASFLFGGHVRTHRFVVLFPGSALRIEVDNLRRLLNERPQIREHLLWSVKALTMHGAQMGLCGVRHNLEQRLACWLCLTCDALDGHTLPLTHDYFSDLLALRRAGVTETLIRFAEQGLIRKMRRLLQVHDRKRLKEKACGCYSVLANEYSSVGHLGAPAEREFIHSPGDGDALLGCPTIATSDTVQDERRTSRRSQKRTLVSACLRQTA